MFAIVLLVVIFTFTLLGFTQEVDQIALPDLLNDAYLRHIIVFTIGQAFLSTLLSVTLAIPVARALSRRGPFRGRSLLLQLASLSFVIPTMIAVLGIVLIYGYNGWINSVIQLLGWEVGNGYYLYGLTGILIAHLFFNLPLATRVYMQAIATLPVETWRLTTQHGLKSWQIFRFIEWPLLRSTLPSLATIIFLLCFTSFAIVLTLGGGPAATTLEVAIYQAIRFDFNLARGVSLSLLQIVICCVIVIVANLFSRPFSFQSSQQDITQRQAERPDRNSLICRITDTVVLFVFILFLSTPLLAILFSLSITALLNVLHYQMFWHSLYSSIVIALSSASISVVWALMLVALKQKFIVQARFRSAAFVDILSVVILVFPPITLGVGLFLLLRQVSNIYANGIYLVILINAMMTLPFVFRILCGPAEAITQRHSRLCESLGLERWQQWRFVYLPQMRTPLAFALAVSATLSAGDMGVIALFGTQDLATLPLLIYRLMGSYQLEQAIAVAVVLGCLCLFLFFGIERGLGYRRA